MSLGRAIAMEPPLGATAERYRDADLLDCFGIILPKATRNNAYGLACLAMSEPPIGFRALMALRDGIMSRFGVQTSGQILSRRPEMSHIDFFPVVEGSDLEIEVGMDDSHLAFRAWFTLEETCDGMLLRLTSVAQAHNFLGRAYLAVIRPLHIVVVRAALHRVLKRLSDPAWRPRV